MVHPQYQRVSVGRFVGVFDLPLCVNSCVYICVVNVSVESEQDATNMGRPHFEGYLILKTGNPFSRRWVKRWFVLDGNQLHCFLNQTDHNAINTVYFSEAAIFNKDKKKEIELKFANHRTYQFRAQSTNSYEAWLIAFNRGKAFKGQSLGVCKLTIGLFEGATKCLCSP